MKERSTEFKRQRYRRKELVPGDASDSTWEEQTGQMEESLTDCREQFPASPALEASRPAP